jgi:group I intron endonuclease
VIVYLVINKINGKMYIGQTIYSLEFRRAAHEYLSLRKDKVMFHRALKKYGKENFEWIVLEECMGIDILNFREQCYIIEFGTLVPYGYNLSSGGRNKRVHDLTKGKISKYMKGRPKSDAHCRSLSLRLKELKIKPPSRLGMVSPRKGVVLSEEIKMKMRKPHRKLPHKK